MATDATTELIRSLDDDQKWVTLQRVSVFKPHTAIADDGSEYTVTEDDLREIADNTNRAYREHGHPVRLTIGHLDPKLKTVAQAPLVGFAINYQAEVVERPSGPQIRLLHTEKVRREMADWWMQMPYRSAEYNRRNKIIRGCAGIIETPRLELGAVSNYSAVGSDVTSLVYYSTGEIAVDETANTTAPAGIDVDALASKIAELVKGMLTGNAKPDKPEEMQNSARKPEQQYAAINAQLAAVKADLAASRQQQDRLLCERLLDTIEGHYSFDREHEVSYMLTLPSSDDRVKRLDYLRKHLRQLPTGSMIRVANPPTPNPSKDTPLSAEESYQAREYRDEKKCSWEEAYSHVKSQRRK